MRLGVVLAWALAAGTGLTESTPEPRELRTGALFEPAALRVPEPPPTHVLATAYCPCEVCCGRWATLGGMTRSGAPAEEGTTIAADWRVFPKGACLVVEGVGSRLVQDTGSKIKGARLDVFFDSHQDAVEFGVQRLQVEPCRGRV